MALKLPFHLLWTALALSLHGFLARAAPTDIPSAASFYVPRLPGLHQNASHPLHIFSGHLSSDPDISSAAPTDVTPHLFFVLVKPRRIADKERIVFWFNGGPGCSSFDGLMMEVGPWRIDGNGGLKTVDGGWEEYTTMVYVDQPVGTGFSYTSTDKYVHELSDAAAQFVQFLKNFYLVFPEYEQMDTYLAGESYAGQYIPYLADAVLNGMHTRLLGIAIGNGWIDSRTQYPAYLEYAVKHGIVEEGSQIWTDSKAVIDDCMPRFDEPGPEPINISKCESILGVVASGRLKKVDGQEMCMNVYDVRLDDFNPACGMNWPPDLKNVTSYLGRPQVKAALHATGKAESWAECTGRVSQELWNNKSPSSITLMPGLLARIPVLIFAGDQDFVCNYVGLENMIQKMEWNGAKGLGTVETKSWSVAGKPAGTWVESRNLTYVKVFNSSHMVPFDLPHVAHDMILRFMGVNFSALTDGSASIPSTVGNDAKPEFIETPAQESGAAIPLPTGKSPEQDKAMWEAYYNAGSAALVLLLIAIAVGLFLFCRRRRRVAWLPVGTKEEHIPLSQHIEGESAAVSGLDGEELEFRGSKGKGRAESEVIFGVGDSDDEGDLRDDARRP